MLQTLITNTYNVPSLVLMFPVDAKGFFGKARSLFQKEMCLMFVCPVTKKPAKSGPNGLGYRVKVTKEWVKKAAPVLIIGLKIAQLAMNAYGIPFPFPSLPLDKFQTDLLDLLADEIDNQFEAKDDIEDKQFDAYQNVKDALDTAESECVLCYSRCILHHTTLYYITLYYTILYYTILYYTILYYIMLYYTIPYCSVLYCTLPFLFGG